MKDHQIVERLIVDSNMDEGMKPEAYNEAVNSLVTSMFNFDQSIFEIVRHEYTNWQSQTDPIELRRQYINVSTTGYSSCTSDLCRSIDWWFQ